MAGLLALPNELKDMTELSTQDLIRLSQTSKSFRSEFQPLLFKRVSLQGEAQFMPSPISGILEAILRSPQNAEMVQELHLSARGFKYGEKAKLDYVTGAAKALIDIALQNMHKSGLVDENAQSDYELLHIVLTIIIVHCPHLRILHMDLKFLHENVILPKVLQRLGHLRRGNEMNSYMVLGKVEEVSLLLETNDGPITWWPIFPFASHLPFLQLPSLRRIKTRLADCKPPSDAWPTGTPPMRALRKLDLHRTPVKTSILASLLAQTPCLESLRYKFIKPQPTDVSDMLDCTQLCAALRSVAGTLVDLTVSSWHSTYEGMGSSCFLENSKKLETPLPILLGWENVAGIRLSDALPAILNDICLRDDEINSKGMMWWEERTMEEVRHWLEMKDKGISTPHVRRFGYKMHEALHQQWYLDDIETLMEICKLGGLEYWYERGDDAGNMTTSKLENFLVATRDHCQRGYGRWNPDLGAYKGFRSTGWHSGD